jgi:hypothetical protein
MAGFPPRHRFPPMRNRRSPECTPPSPGLLHIGRKRPRPPLFCNNLGFIPLRFIVAPLLPRLCRPVDGEIRAKNSGGTVVKARNSGRAFILCRGTLRFSEMPSKPDRPSPSSSDTPQSCNVLVGHVAGVTRHQVPPIIAAHASSQPLAVGVNLG